jgi:hypothetical protein
MKSDCKTLHEWAWKLLRHTFPFNEKELPLNGLYLLFEKGEQAHGGDRIVRVGTHTGQNQLISRLRQHFLVENKDRSIFRKNIGRCLLNKAKDQYLLIWERDFTSKLARDTHAKTINALKQKQIEKKVSEYMQKNFSFAVLEIPEKERRLHLESKIISTLSLCEECLPSSRWLGLYSPKGKIRESGLWLVNELYKTPLNPEDFVYLRSI